MAGTYLLTYLTLDVSPLISDRLFHCDSFNHPWPHVAPRDASYLILPNHQDPRPHAPVSVERARDYFTFHAPHTQRIALKTRFSYSYYL